MAEHADPAEVAAPTDAAESAEDADVEPVEARTQPDAKKYVAKPRTWKRREPKAAVIAGSLAVVALGSLAGWLGDQVYEDRRAVAERELFVSAARQAVLNLTTIDYTTIDADVQRVLDSTTGAFHDDFQSRAGPFADVVKQAQSKSEGTVSNAAVASEDGDHAQVVMTVSVKMSNAGTPEQQPRSWRMRIEVQKTGDSAKVSNVQFVS